MIKVHYFFDPMCGWCYGATTLVEIIEKSAPFELIYHPGGMIPKQAIASSFRQHILHSDTLIATQTGALFGDAYKARVNSTEPFVIDSYLPIRAILVGEEMGITPLHTLKAIQQAHYQLGEHTDTLETLQSIAVSQGLDEAIWQEKMANTASKVNDTIETSHTLMGRLQVNGYPTLIAEIDGNWVKLPHTNFYQNTSQWREYLNSLI